MEKCPDHPKYKANRKPRSKCPKCWEMFQLKRREDPNISSIQRMKDLAEFMRAVR